MSLVNGAPRTKTAFSLEADSNPSALSSAFHVSVLVLRLQWQSRALQYLISGPLLRDQFIGKLVPKPGSTFTFCLFGRHTIHIDVLAVSPKPKELCKDIVGTETTKAFLVPSIPPWLQAKFLVPFTTESFAHGSELEGLLRIAFDGNQVVSQLDLTVSRVILVHSPLGCGKTSAVCWATHACGATLIRVQPTDILTDATGTAKALHAAVDRYVAAAEAAAPAVVFLDDAHFVFPAADTNEDGGDISAAAVVPLFADRVRRHPRIALILAASPSPTAVHAAVRSAVDTTVAVQVAVDSDVAKDIVTRHASCPMNDEIASRFRACTERFLTIADVTAWARSLPSLRLNCEKGGQFDIDDDALTKKANAGNGSDNRVEDDPSILVQQWDRLQVELPGVNLALDVLRRVLLWPRTRADIIRRLGIRSPRGVLLYGAPGTGKTAVVRAAIKAAEYNVLSMDAATLSHGEVGESEMRLKASFDRAARMTPCAIFFDEIDTLFGNSGGLNALHSTRLVTALAQCFDHLPHGVVVLAATNRPWVVESSLLRPGRFDYRVKLSLPDATTRASIADVYAYKMALKPAQRDALVLIAASDDATHFSGADIAGACRRAAMSALWRGTNIENDDLSKAFHVSQPSVSVKESFLIDTWEAR